MATRPVPGPDHYSGIKAHPHSLRGWLLEVFCCATIQAALVGIFANVLGAFLLLIFPLMLMANPVFFTYLGVLIGFVVGSAFAGHYFPHYAFYRSGLAFLFVSLADVIQVNYLEQRPGLFVMDEYSLLQAIPFALLGALVCAFAGSLGSRWHRGIGEWLQEEWDEFRDSMQPNAEAEETGEETPPEDEKDGREIAEV